MGDLYIRDNDQLLANGGLWSLIIENDMVQSCEMMDSLKGYDLSKSHAWDLVTDPELIELYERFKLVVDHANT